MSYSMCFYFNSTRTVNKLAQGVCEIQNGYLYPVKGWYYYIRESGRVSRQTAAQYIWKNTHLHVTNQCVSGAPDTNGKTELLSQLNYQFI